MIGRWLRRAAPRRRPVLLAVAVVLLLSGCGVTSAGLATRAKSQPGALHIVASVWPLASIANYIGQGDVTATDLTTPGVNPAGLVPTARQKAEIRRAALVLDVGGSYQRALDATARLNRHTLSLWPEVGGNDPDVWLQPDLMMRAAKVIGDALTRVDPSRAATFRQGVADFRAVVSSVNIDYTNSLSDCGHKTFVTADGAFSGLAKEYGLTDVVVGNGAVTHLVALVRADELHVVYREPLVSSSVVSAVARAADVRLQTLDTMAARPAGGWPAQATYDQLMEANLAELTNGLACEAMGGSTL